MISISFCKEVCATLGANVDWKVTTGHAYEKHCGFNIHMYKPSLRIHMAISYVDFSNHF